MQNLARRSIGAGGAMLIVLAAAGSARAADVAIVDVPQGMILETQAVRTSAPAALRDTPTDFVVTHDLRVGNYVVIAAGSHGVGHLVRATHGARVAPASRIAYDYVLASDGTRIPVAGALPNLTTSANRPVVIYGADDDGRALP